MARPRINPDRPLNFTSQVVLNRTEYDFILACAKKEGISFSQWMRDAAAEAIKKKEYKPTPKRGQISQLPDLC